MIKNTITPQYSNVSRLFHPIGHDANRQLHMDYTVEGAGDVQDGAGGCSMAALGIRKLLEQGEEELESPWDN